VTFKTIIIHDGFVFEVSGDWVPPVPETRTEPADGGYFREGIEILLCAVPANKILNTETIAELEELAAEQALEELRSGPERD